MLNNRLTEYYNRWVEDNGLMNEETHKLIALMELVDSEIEDENYISCSDFEELCNKHKPEIF